MINFLIYSIFGSLKPNHTYGQNLLTTDNKIIAHYIISFFSGQ